MITQNTVSKSEFKPKALHYLRWVEKHKKPLIITHNQKPVAKVIPYSQKDDPKKELQGSVLKYESPLEPVGVEDWEALG